MRQKLSTHEKLYVAIHGELAAKKDRLRGQTEELERLRALKVAVIDPLPESSLPEAETPVESHLSIDLELELEPEADSTSQPGT